MQHATYTANRPLRICIISDAWHPQVNGVVRTLDTLRCELKKIGHRVYMVTPQFFKTIPCPTYPEISLSLASPGSIEKIFARWAIDAVHIATEGPLGWAARRACLQTKRPFTTAYHTAFPEYIAARTPIKANLIYPLLRHFHNAGNGILVATETVRQQLKAKGFKNIAHWSRGVDTSIFHPSKAQTYKRKTPSLLYVGRVAVEKNLEAFFACNVPGKKIVVGDGPALKDYRTQYPDVTFLGSKFGDELAEIYASADVFVFPSKTDTFGLVMIEALASGTPVAAYPVQGPIDVLGHDGCGPFKDWSHPVAALNDDLQIAISEALDLQRENCTEFAKHYTWQTVAQQFLSALVYNYSIKTAQEYQSTVVVASSN